MCIYTGKSHKGRDVQNRAILRWELLRPAQTHLKTDLLIQQTVIIITIYNRNRVKLGTRALQDHK